MKNRLYLLGLAVAGLVSFSAAAEDTPEASGPPAAVEPAKEAAPTSSGDSKPAPEEKPKAASEDDAFLNPQAKPSESTAVNQEAKKQQPAEETGDKAFLTNTEKPEIEAPIQETDVDLGRKEDPKKAYYGIGGRFRWLMVPEWAISMFGVDVKRAAGKSAAVPIVNNPAAGLEFTYRKAGLDIIAAIWWADMSWDETIAFKGSGEDHNGWEITENDMQGLLLTADFIWSHSFTDWVAITYGLGAGLGVRFGEVLKTEATHASGHLEKCAGEADPDIDCQPDEDYGKPDSTVEDFVVFPWLNFLLGFRFKPHRNVAINIDGGFGFGFQVGTRIGYIF